MLLKDNSMSFEEVLLCYYSENPLSVLSNSLNTIKMKEGKNMARIINQALVDLRNFSPAALKKIKSMINVTLVMLPENPGPDFSEAYSSIKKTNVISEINVSSKACIFNGMSILSKENIADNCVVVCNGLTVIRDIPKEKNIKVIVNGTLIKSPSAFFEIIKINGTSHNIDDEAKLIKSISEMVIDKNFINNLSEKTAIIVCGKIHIDDEVTEEMLQSKGIVFYVIEQIIAKKELHGYIRVNSYNVSKVCTKEECERNEKKGLKRLFGWK